MYFLTRMNVLFSINLRFLYRQSDTPTRPATMRVLVSNPAGHTAYQLLPLLLGGDVFGDQVHVL